MVDPYVVLRSELATQAYSGLSDADAAAALNSPTAGPNVAVSSVDARYILLTSPWWGAICIAADGATIDPTIRAIAITVRDTLLHTSMIATDAPEVRSNVAAMLNALVSAGLLDGATRDRLLALTASTTTRAAQLGLPWVGGPSAYDVHIARGAQ